MDKERVKNCFIKCRKLLREQGINLEKNELVSYCTKKEIDLKHFEQDESIYSRMIKSFDISQNIFLFEKQNVDLAIESAELENESINLNVNEAAKIKSNITKSSIEIIKKNDENKEVCKKF